MKIGFLELSHVFANQVKLPYSTGCVWSHCKTVDEISNHLSIDVSAYDERLTSQIAKQSLILQGVKTGHNKKDVDKTAAAIFLQNYLDEL